MKPSDWIALAQAVFLALAALFAWLTYKAAKREREAARLEPVKREVQVLAELIEKWRTAASDGLLAEILGQQARLSVALDHVSDPLPKTRLLARQPKNDLLDGGQLQAARAELADV